MLTANLAGFTALVTGGGSGIGFATARRLAECGATVVANVFPGDQAALSALKNLEADGIPVVAVEADVADGAQVDAMMDRIADRFGRLDLLVNNAAVNLTREPIPFDRLEEMTDAFWSTLLSINLMGPFRCARAAAPMLKAANGAIVNVASISAFTNRGTSIAYSASKAGVVSLTRSLSRALAPDVRVNAVAPGYVVTPLTENWSDERKRLSASRSLLGRGARPEEIADAILMLGVGGSFVNGQTLIVDGGAA